MDLVHLVAFTAQEIAGLHQGVTEDVSPGVLRQSIRKRGDMLVGLAELPIRASSLGGWKTTTEISSALLLHTAFSPPLCSAPSPSVARSSITQVSEAARSFVRAMRLVPALRMSN